MSNPNSNAAYIKRKVYLPDTYYHIYSRGINKDVIFKNDDDKKVFIALLKRYLSPEPPLDKSNRPYKSYYGQIELLTYALMPNHFHLLIHQAAADDIVHFMRSLMTSYAMYFNRVHKHFGPVFQSRYLAKKINDDQQLMVVSRYIHLNPSNWDSSTDTSLDFYSGNRNADWITPNKVLRYFPTRDAYLEFLRTYDPTQDELELDLEPDERILKLPKV